jgi:hypothetical protein
LAVSAAALLLFQAASGLVLWLAFPRGQGAGGGLGRDARALKGGIERTFAGIERSTWVTIHDWAAVLFVVIVVIHVAVHWKWVIRQTRAVFTGSRATTQTEARCAD